MSNIDDDKNIQKLLQIRLLYFLFTIPHKVIFKDSTYVLGTANLKNTSLLVRTISIACTIACQRLFIPNSVSIGFFVGTGLEENGCSTFFYQSEEVINEGFTF